MHLEANDEQTSSETAADETRTIELLRAQGIVRDVAAAAACMCSCHPRTAAHHDGGASCPCQLSPQEREAQFEQALAALESIAHDPESITRRAALDAKFDAVAAALDVQIDRHGGMAPYVICGVVDGRAFYLRERHDMWRVVIAPDNDPLVNPWGERDVDGVCVAEGTTDFDGEDFELDALVTAVRAVRGHLRRRACIHVGSSFCQTCGVELDESWWRGDRRR